LAEVLNSTHESSTCPICQSMASAQKANADVPKFENLGVNTPRSEEAPATKTANVTGGTTKSASSASYVEALRMGPIWDLSAGETLSYSYYTGPVGYDNSYSNLAAAYNAPLTATPFSAPNQTFLDQAFAAWDLASAFTLEKVTESGTAVG